MESDLPTVSSSLQQHQTLLPPCTPEDQHRVRPKDVTKKQYELVRQGEEVAAYIVTELHKVDVPVTLLFGTALHEYRNGTGNCVQPNFKEDDFDIGVLSHHFNYVVLLINKVEQKFGWRGFWKEHDVWKDNFLYFSPPGQKLKGGFQIDVYSIKVDEPKEGLIHFRWDGFQIEKHSLLPLVKHKPVVSSNETATANDGSVPHYYMPYNITCYLRNLYGETYMTPRPGFKSGNAYTGLLRYNNPPCGGELSDRDSVEMKRQMSFLNNSNELQREADRIWSTFPKYGILP